MNNLKQPASKGFFASLILLSVYFLVLTLVSGRQFAWEQFMRYWYYIVSLAIGFGIQFGLYSYLKKAASQNRSVVAASGTTSGTAMISCCTHYLTNIAPTLASSGIIAFIGAYQVQFFWLGLFFNFLGIAYMLDKVVKFSKMP